MKNIERNNLIKDVIVKENGTKVLDFVKAEIDLSQDKTIILSMPDMNNFPAPDQSSVEDCHTIIDLKCLNKNPNLNTYLRGVNSKLKDASIYIGCFEGYSEHKRIYTNYPSFVAKGIWASKFVIHRMMPKLASTKKMYFLFSRGKQPLLSKAEALGRLCYAGFEIIGCEKIDDKIYFSAMKTGEPKTVKEPSGGLFFKMRRISVGGKIIGVYKIRTMHPYSEYLHEYVVKLNGYNKTGKPNNDFRLTSWGKMIRKFYLDEIPQLINVIKGDLGIVGVRPISQSGFKALPKDLQVERVKYKPGCIPPNVSLGITGFDGVIRAERIYLKHMATDRFSTNFKYFWMAVVNIVSRKSKSS